MLLKICGITRLEDLRAAEAAGAAYAGVILVPASPRGVTAETAAPLFAAARIPVVCVVRDLPLADLQALIARLRPAAVQLHGGESPDYARAIADADVWKAVDLRSTEALAEAADFPAAMIVADSGGGSGKPCCWDLAAELARRRPVMLAGGLTPENVREAIRTVRPAGVDVSSGVESAPGVKDHWKIRLLAERIGL